jgi:mannose-6-phosphate isomerase-like protein (cupin superfamily)
MHPDVHGNRAQSLAEATVGPGCQTLLHRHRQTEEIYYFLSGQGRLQIDDASRTVRAGDTVLIPPGSWHSVRNEGRQRLVFLCCCSPAYSHADTELSCSPDGGPP